MKSKLLLFIIFFISITTNAQIIFEKGYFINNNNQKTECLIKNLDWRKNPTDYKYKLSQNDLAKVATISSVKESSLLHEVVDTMKAARMIIHNETVFVITFSI